MHDEHYERTDEYLDIFRKAWTSHEPFDYDGKHYKVQDNLTAVRPPHKPHLPIYFSGAPDAAVQYGQPLLPRIRALVAGRQAQGSQRAA